MRLIVLTACLVYAASLQAAPINSEDTYFLNSSSLTNGTQNAADGFTYKSKENEFQALCPKPFTDTTRSTEMVSSNKRCTVTKKYQTSYIGKACTPSRKLVSSTNSNCKYVGGGSGGNGACGANGCGGGAGGGGG